MRAKDSRIVRVKTRERFVENHEARIAHELACERDAAHFAAAERLHEVMLASAQPEKFAELFESRKCILLEVPHVHRRTRPVENSFLDGQLRAERRVLRQYCNAPANLVFAVIDTADAHNALLVAAVDALNHLQKRGLSLSGTPDNRKNLAGGEFEINPL